MKRKDFPSQVKALIRNPERRQRRNFRERRKAEVRRINLPRTSVNKGMKESRGR